MYKIGQKVLVFDGGFWTIPATIIATEDELYQVQYVNSRKEWFTEDELRPTEYHKGDYVHTMIGVGKVIDTNPEYSMITIFYGKQYANETRYEFEVKPIPKPSFWARLLKKDIYHE